MSEILSVWTTSRALGLSAYLLFFLSMATGMMQSMKGLLPKYRAALHVTHQSASWFAWIFTLAHAWVLIYDSYVGFTLQDLFIPFYSKYETWAMTAGILGFYLMLILILSTDLMKKIGKKWWRSIHSLSFLGFALSLGHGLLFSAKAGTPVNNLYVLTFSILIVMGLYRYFHAKRLANQK
ncbi:ferric reductase-like transmembrane domain-containing protein [Ammoniphilus resinae]|uniref:DMSO/TMAO reductase YedYZ heme-binding membrane subunit n=1 Tax=Ammoniphilus resinae TaxID=861532 RepID=A0ABS4GLR1_9BACL|nr:ferric reductase-like transmembrane domain-containing protein [Ammoniphilus resinae]MBP1931012.1 DMSO/TMAO reductase YedYZ heme-binding membrane subunit [Ammoniphilus resinae]